MFQTKSRKVLQLKIILLNTRPKTWRRIQIPANFTFAQLHKTILYAMEWNETKFHLFEANNWKSESQDLIGFKMDENWNFYGPQIRDENEIRLFYYLNNENKTIRAFYEIDDVMWELKIILEKKVLRVKEENYPICVDGRFFTPGAILGFICALGEFNPKIAFNHFPYNQFVYCL